MPDRGKERDGTDGIALPSSLLPSWEQTAAAHGHTGNTAPAALTCMGFTAPAPALGFRQPHRSWVVKWMC